MSNNILEFSFMVQAFFEMLKYLPVTLLMASASMLLACALGLISAVVQIRKIPVLRQIAHFYLLIGRAIPNMVMLYLVYFGLPVLLMAFTAKTGIRTGYENISPLAFAIIGLMVHTGAYLSEIFRAALLSVDKGQMEAALSIGMTWFQGFRRIIFRQAALFALPMVANQFLGLIKSTSIAFTITVIEILGAAKIACADNYRYLETFLVVAVIYWMVCIVFEKLFLMIEKRVGSFKKGANV